MGATRGLDVGGLRGPLHEAVQRVGKIPFRKMIAAIHVPPDVAWERIVTAINELERAGCEKVDLHGLPPPDAATRQATPLPR